MEKLLGVEVHSFIVCGAKVKEAAAKLGGNLKLPPNFVPESEPFLNTFAIQIPIQMHTLEELKQQVQKLIQNPGFDSIVPILKEIWEMEQTEFNGWQLAKHLRKSSKFQEARKLHEVLSKKFPNSNRIKNDFLWLEYSEKIKNWKNQKLISDAESLLQRTDQKDKYTGSIYNKTVLTVVKHLLYESENHLALEWLSNSCYAVV